MRTTKRKMKSTSERKRNRNGRVTGRVVVVSCSIIGRSRLSWTPDARQWTPIVVVVSRFPQPLPSIARSVLHPFSPPFIRGHGLLRVPSASTVATPRLELRWLKLSRKGRSRVCCGPRR